MTVESRVLRLSQAVGTFCNPGPTLEKLCNETPHMAPESMARGLKDSLAGWSESGIRALWEQEQPFLAGAQFPSKVAVILGGVLPPSHIQAIAYPYLLGADVMVQYPSADPVFPVLFSELLGPKVTAMSRSELGEQLIDADAVVVVGDDSSIRAVESSIPVSVPVLGFGRRASVGLITDTTHVDLSAAGFTIAKDVGTFDQLGCLSPAEIIVVGDRRFAVLLAESIAAHLNLLPARTRLDVGAEATLRGYRSDAIARGVPVYGPDDLQWGITVERDGQWVGTPGGRHVIIRYLNSVTQIVDVLKPLKGHLSAIGFSGPALDREIQRELVRFGASRFVPLGTMQHAPPTWPHDGRRPLAALCRWCGDE